MRRVMVVSFLVLTAVVLSAPAADTRMRARSVTCCLEASIDGGMPRPVCVVLNVRPRRVRARAVCRLIGGTVQTPMEGAS